MKASKTLHPLDRNNLLKFPTEESTLANNLY